MANGCGYAGEKIKIMNNNSNQQNQNGTNGGMKIRNGGNGDGARLSQPQQCSDARDATECSSASGKSYTAAAETAALRAPNSQTRSVATGEAAIGGEGDDALGTASPTNGE